MYPDREGDDDAAEARDDEARDAGFYDEAWRYECD